MEVIRQRGNTIRTITRNVIWLPLAVQFIRQTICTFASCSRIVYPCIYHSRCLCCFSKFTFAFASFFIFYLAWNAECVCVQNVCVRQLVEINLYTYIFVVCLMNVNADEQHPAHALITMKLENFQDNLGHGILYIVLSSHLQCNASTFGSSTWTSRWTFHQIWLETID